MALEEIHEWNRNIFDEKLRTQLLPEEEGEIRRFEAEIAKLERGELDPDDFRRFRLNNGIYGIRGAENRHMIRIKIRWGNMNALQLERIADIIQKYAPNKLGHAATRQDSQLD